MLEPLRYPGGDPNFPENLDIKPSSYLDTNQHTPLADDSPSDVFGMQAQEAAIRQYGIAGRVWEAAYAMVLYVRPPSGWEFNPPFISDFPGRATSPQTIIELGSGVGLVGAIIAEILDPQKDSIIVTDLPEVCPLLENNFRETFQSSKGKDLSSRDVFAVRSLAWGNSEHALQIADDFLSHRERDARFLTHIICSDLVYFPGLLAPLLRTLIQLSSPPFCRTDIPQNAGSPKVIISYKIRSLAKETPFWSAFGLWFEFEPVLVRDATDAHWRRFGSELEDAIFVFVACRRIKSFSWPVPSDDNELLNGVGARGLDATQGDDTFESLLLMSLQIENST